MSTKKKVTEMAAPASDAAPVETNESNQAAPVEVLPYEPFTCQAAIDAYEDFKINPNKVFEFFTNEINIDHSLNGRRNPRSADDADIKELAADIVRNGMIEPAVGWFEEGTNFAYVGAGYGRCVALDLANSTRAENEQIMLRVVFDPAITTKAQALKINISENMRRKNLNSIDIADNMKRLKDEGLSNVEIGDAFGMVKSAVTGYLSLLKLPDYVQSAIADGKLSMRNGLELVALTRESPEKVEKTALKLIEKAEETGKPATTKEGRAEAAEAGSGRAAVPTPNFKSVKDLVAGSTGPGEDVRVQVVNLVLTALISGSSEKEYGIGKVSEKNYTKKLTEALDKVSTAKATVAANKGKAA